MRRYNSSDSAFYDSNNLIVSLNCTAQELDDAFRQYHEHKTITPLLRDYLHEHAHYLQFTTTNVGMYYTLIETYQFQRLLAVFNYITESKDKIYPMFPSIMNIENGEIVDQKAAHHFYYWALAELVRLHMWGEYDVIDAYLEHMMRGDGYFDYYLELDLDLKRLYAIPDDWHGTLGPESDMVKDKLKGAAFIETFASMNFASITESEALLAEYWFDEVADERLLRLLNNNDLQTVERSYYLLPLMMFMGFHSLDLTDRGDFLSFKLGFHAICQIVLNSPLLPYQKKDNLLPEIDANEKFIMLITYSKTPLPKNEEDYSRYIDEIIKEFQLKPLEESYRELKQNEDLLMNRKLSQTSFKEEVFISAQNMYAKDPVYYYRFLNGTYSKTSMFSIKFNDSDLDYPVERMPYLVEHVLRSFYVELLYGYNCDRFQNGIDVKTPVKLSPLSMRLLQHIISMYNIEFDMLHLNMPRINLVNE